MTSSVASAFCRGQALRPCQALRVRHASERPCTRPVVSLLGGGGESVYIPSSGGKRRGRGGHGVTRTGKADLKRGASQPKRRRGATTELEKSTSRMTTRARIETEIASRRIRSVVGVSPKPYFHSQNLRNVQPLLTPALAAAVAVAATHALIHEAILPLPTPYREERLVGQVFGALAWVCVVGFAVQLVQWDSQWYLKIWQQLARGKQGVDALVSCVMGVFFFSPASQWQADYMMVPLYLMGAGEWWRLITCTLLHANVLHLAVNLRSLGVLSRGWEYGAGGLVAVLAVGGLCSSLLSALFLPVQGASLGVSGVVCSILGAHLVRARGRWRSNILQNVLLMGLLGLMIPQIDNWAHLGGLIGGYVSATALTLLQGAWAATGGRGRGPAPPPPGAGELTFKSREEFESWIKGQVRDFKEGGGGAGGRG